MISVIIPFHNEAENLSVLVAELLKTLAVLNQDYEVVLIDDGSTDQGAQKIAQYIDGQKMILLRHGVRLGKGKALFNGFKHSRGEIIVLMDADLQDNPADLPKFIKKLSEGYDLVNGAREDRKDNFIVKFYSRLANGFLRFVLHSPFSDINCGFKAFRRSILTDIVIYANNFRFLPLAAYHYGYRVTEIPVVHQPRLYGKSKYGIKKIFIGIFDTLNALFLFQFSERPLHFFGIIGGFFFIIGSFWTALLVVERLIFGILLYRRPALLLAILLIIVGIQIIMTGILGELIVYLDKKNSQRNK